jgi:hypothetical protein
MYRGEGGKSTAARVAEERKSMRRQQVSAGRRGAKKARRGRKGGERKPQEKGSTKGSGEVTRTRLSQKT